MNAPPDPPNVEKRRGPRRDIQALRAIAVLVVVFDHFLGWPLGGFVGVDVFFVISGFLITGLLVREHEKTGTISFLGFYRRRIKRIIPAATLVLVVVAIVSWLMFAKQRALSTNWDAAWSFLFAANWRFANVGTDYFQADGPTSPLQHYWSLSVEEQFYFVWPWLMLGILALATVFSKTAPRRRTVAGIAMAVIVLASFGWAMLQSASSPTWAYFSTFTRAWELGIGALGALAAPWWGRIPTWCRPVLAWVGIVGIAASVAFTSEHLAFPGPWAAPAVISTALVIIAGTGAPSERYLGPLVSRPVVWLGDVSYSLYLWHLPVIVFVGVAAWNDPVLYYSLTPALMLVFAVAAYYLLERPLHHSPWLEPRTGMRSGSWSAWRRRHGRRLAYGWAAAAAVCALAVASLALAPRTEKLPAAALTVSEQKAENKAETPEPEPEPEPEPPTIDEQIAEILQQSLDAQVFPELVPSVDQLGLGAWVDGSLAEGCTDVVRANVDSCIFGPPEAQKNVVVLGDSFGMAWMPGLREALGQEGYRVHQITLAQCPPIDIGLLNGEGAPFTSCTGWRNLMIERIHAIHPDLLILSSAYTTFGRMASGAGGIDAQNELSAGTAAVIDRLVGAAERIVVLESPPHNIPLGECAVPGAVPENCVSDPTIYWSILAQAQRDAAASRSVEYVPVVDWFCVADRCPAFAGNVPIKVDGKHLSIEYSRFLGPALRERLFPGSAAQNAAVVPADPEASENAIETAPTGG